MGLKISMIIIQIKKDGNLDTIIKAKQQNPEN